MDYLIDSDLSEVFDFDIDEPAPIRPYQYEPIPNAGPETVSSDEEITSDSDSLENDIDEQIPDVSIWCQCNNCINMPTMIEAKCCRTTNVVDGKIEPKSSCITDHEGFTSNCLNIHVLEVAYYDYVLTSGHLEENQQIHQLYRHIAYRRFTRWVYGLLGKRTRRVIPACVVTAIRNSFPSEEYCGFKYPQ